MSWIEQAIDRLLIEGNGAIYSRIDKLGVDLPITGTEAKGYCYSIKLDSQGNPRIKDMIEYIATKIVDYSIPKKLQDDAINHLLTTNSTSKVLELQNKAKELFTDLSQTGEFGEMLLYILVQEVLKLPQLMSKMSLKTSSKMHYHGVDGVHIKYEKTDNSLSIYWGESKMEKTLNSALRNCFNSLKGFLLDTYEYDSTQSRDLQLITSNIADNINNPELEQMLVKYFDLDNDLSNNLRYKGVCFVGFDSENYPTNPYEKTALELQDLFTLEIKQWLDKTGKNIKKHINLEKFEIHIFLIPFPSVQDFRTKFLKLISK